jgi:hypothetical protein
MCFLELHKLFKSHRVKFSKNQIIPQNISTPNIILNKGLVMPCGNCTMMGFVINLILTPNHYATYRIMNEFIAFKSKKQPKISLFIL